MIKYMCVGKQSMDSCELCELECKVEVPENYDFPGMCLLGFSGAAPYWIEDD